MRIPLPAAACLLSFALISTGCHRREFSRDLEVTLTPHRDAGTVDVECRKSTSDKCYLTFTGDEPTELSVHEGAKVTVRGVGANTMYCAETQPINQSKCKQTSLPLSRTTLRKATIINGQSGE